MGESRYMIDWIKPTKVMEGAGVQLQMSIGTSRLDYLDPFLLFDHFGSDDPRTISLVFQCILIGELKPLHTC
jgi:hypothetical protein